MTRPPKLEEGQTTKTFVVKQGYSIGDNNNVRKNGGDTIELSHKQAVHFMKQGVIEVDIPEFDEDDDTSTDDQTKDEAGTETDGGGDTPVRASAATSPIPTETKGRGRGK